MKERPILFSAPMVRALLAGTKTQTRRVVKPWEPRLMNLRRPVPDDVSYLPDFTCYRSTCPYGQPGDRLWVREAWRLIDVADCFAPREITAAHRIWFEADGPHEPPAGRYRPGMFMPRWASRITLEVTGVRVERLQDISEADAIAEGATPLPDPCDHARRSCADIGCAGPRPYTVGYRSIWQNINGPGSWDANPWVWVVEFKQLDRGA